MILGSKLFINDLDLLSNDLSLFTCVLLDDGFNKRHCDNEGRTITLKHICRFICQKVPDAV